MRAILVDWLIEVHHSFKLQEETLFLAVNYLDRFLSAERVPRKTLQLVGIGALFVGQYCACLCVALSHAHHSYAQIAAKLEEIDPVEIADLTFVCNETFTADEIIA
ncbi:hypothetical protein PINS_up012258 [Pythium insidiosum]|nr:hypothetical protein PINS_up012258 [Pythium insidiosum]